VFEKNFNVDKFLFESVVKRKGEVDGDSKMKTIFHTEVSFPFVKTRLEVIQTHEIILSPIEFAIELIDDRLDKLNHELNKTVPSPNSLQQLLQGSVVPMVNEGPLKICDTFLSVESMPRYRTDQVELLKVKMAMFIKLCGFALALNKRLVTEEQKPFQQMLETHYKSLKIKVAEYLS